VVDVTIDSAWDVDQSGLDTVLKEFLGQSTDISHGVGGTNNNNTVEIIFLGSLDGSFLMTRGSENIFGTAEVILTTKVLVWGEAFSGHFNNLIFEETLKTIDKTEELDTFSLFGESEETINNVVATRGGSAKLQQSNALRLGGLAEHLLVKGIQGFIIVDKALVSQKLILNFNEIVGGSALAKIWVLFTDLGSDKFGDREVFLDTSAGIGTLRKHLWNLSLILDTSLTEFRKQSGVSVKGILKSLFLVFNFLSTVSFLNKLFDVRCLYHEVV